MIFSSYIYLLSDQIFIDSLFEKFHFILKTKRPRFLRAFLYQVK